MALPGGLLWKDSSGCRDSLKSIFSLNMPKKASDKPMGVADGVCALSGMVFILMGSMLFFAETPKGERWQAWTVGIAGALFAVSGVAVFVKSRRRDVVPDLLAQLPEAPFEYAGVLFVPAFSPLPAAPGGKVRHAFFYQNRFDARAEVELTVEPSTRWRIDVGPAEVGLVWKDVDVPAASAGEDARLSVVAAGRAGGGKEVRFRAGSVLGNARRANAFMLLGLLAGQAVIPTPASVRIPLRAGAQAAPTPAADAGHRVLWGPESSDEETRTALWEASAIVSRPLRF